MLAVAVSACGLSGTGDARDGSASHRASVSRDDAGGEALPRDSEVPETSPLPDGDGDGASDSVDDCLPVSSPDQVDTDADGVGDSCDNDDDGDGTPDLADSCPLTPDPDQADFDGDGYGDACDACNGFVVSGASPTPMAMVSAMRKAESAIRDAFGEHFGTVDEVHIATDELVVRDFDLRSKVVASRHVYHLIGEKGEIRAPAACRYPGMQNRPSSGVVHGIYDLEAGRVQARFTIYRASLRKDDCTPAEAAQRELASAKSAISKPRCKPTAGWSIV